MIVSFLNTKTDRVKIVSKHDRFEPKYIIFRPFFISTYVHSSYIINAVEINLNDKDYTLISNLEMCFFLEGNSDNQLISMFQHFFSF